MTERGAPDSSNPPERPLILQLGVPADPRFSELIMTAGRIFAGSLPNCRRLQRDLNSALAEAAAKALGDRGDRVRVEFEIDAVNLEVRIVAGSDRSVLRFQVADNESGHPESAP